MINRLDVVTGRPVGGFLGRLLLLGGFALAILWVTIPVAPVPINVRWKPGIVDGERAQFERRFGLVDSRRQDEDTWSYALLDYSHDNIRALITHPAALDTHNINRSTFQPDDPPIGWTTWVLSGAVLFAIAGAAVLTLPAGTVNVKRFWLWTVTAAIVMMALRMLPSGAGDRLLAAAPWLPVAVMLVVGVVASFEQRVAVSQRVQATVVAGAPLLLFALAALMLAAAGVSCEPPWSHW